MQWSALCSDSLCMDRHQVRLGLFKITIAVLALSTWVFSSVVFSTRPQVAEAGNDDALSNLVRLPASLPVFSPAADKVAEPVRMDVVHLPCWDKKDAMIKDTSARWLRLTGRACQLEPQDVSVRNLSNGYVATVFTPKTGDMTTDFIPLQNGKNDILIRFGTEPSSGFESQITFIRD